MTAKDEDGSRRPEAESETGLELEPEAEMKATVEAETDKLRITESPWDIDRWMHIDTNVIALITI